MVNEMLTAGSLFSGIGVIDVAFAIAGFDIRFQVEKSAYCRGKLREHAEEYWPNATRYTDVQRVGGRQLGAVDVLFGGFPCQPHSMAGRRKSHTDSRDLWPDFARIIAEVRPRAILLENVPGILAPYRVEKVYPVKGQHTRIRIGKSRKYPPYAARVLFDLAQMGYDAKWSVVGAADAGAPHQRNRWWCVAYANDIGLQARPDQSGGVQEAALAITPRADDGDEVGNAERHRWKEALEIGGLQEQHGTPNGNHTAGVVLEPALGRDADGPPDWLAFPKWPAGPREAQYDYEPARQVPVRWKDWHEEVKALGNSVVPQVAYPFALEIARHLKSLGEG
jgi:site-specific DNA-cytosine methylase